MGNPRDQLCNTSMQPQPARGPARVIAQRKRTQDKTGVVSGREFQGLHVLESTT